MINLLPDEIKEQRKKEKYKKISIVVIAFLLIGLVITSGYIKDLAADYRGEIEKLNKQLNQLESTKEVLAGQLKVKNNLQDKWKLVNNLKDDLNYSWLIKDLNLIIPNGVWLDQVIIEGNKNILIGGKTRSDQLLLETANRLEKYPYFKEIKINSSQQKDKYLNFIIEGGLRRDL